MAQQAQVKNYWTFVGGLITEAGPLAFPENAALSLDNVVLDIDGSIQPRKGLSNLRPAYSTSSTDTLYQRDVSTAMWLSAGGAEAEDLYVMKAGSTLRFFRATTEEPELIVGADIDLTAYIPSGSAYGETDLDRAPGSMATGDGRLYVVTPYTNPIIVEFEAATENFTVTELIIKERDLEGVDDGTATDFHPSTLTSEHNYNLLNAGWNNAKINSYRSSYGEYPSRSEDPWTGVVEEVNPSNGSISTTFRASQYRALGDAGFGTSEAAKGHFVLETFDTTTIVSSDESTGNSRVRMTFDNPVDGGGGEYTDYDGVFVTVDTQLNIVADNDSVTISGTDFQYSIEFGTVHADIDGVFTADVTTTSQYGFYLTKAQVQDRLLEGKFNFSTSATYAYDSNADAQPVNEGVTTVEETEETIGTVEDKRFESVAFYAGRAFYAGVQPESRDDLAGRVYYSQIIRNKNNASKCYQSNDPSSKDLNDLVDTDGGYITINDLGVVHAMMPFRSSLIVITSNGAWEIGAGDNYFTPSSYLVRRLTDRGSRFRKGVTQIDGRPSYWSTQGLEIISESEITGFPERQSLTDESIKTFVQQDIVAGSVSATYDNIDNKAYWVFQPEGELFSRVLCFDTRLQAFYPWSISLEGGTGLIRGIDHFDNGREERLRFLNQEIPNSGTWQIEFYGMTETDNTDDMMGQQHLFECHIEAGNELLGDGMRYKQAVKLASFFERNADASCFAQGRYDWANSGTSGKWNNKQQAYRDPGEGFDVARSRLRMRGSGPAFRVRYTSEGTAPFKLYGWSVLYLGGDRV